MELRHPDDCLSALLDRRVVDRAGKRVGRVYEVHAEIDSDGFPVVRSLMIGRRALLRRLRGPGGTPREIPWEQVLEVGEDAITVAAPR